MFLFNLWTKFKNLECELALVRAQLAVEQENYRLHIAKCNEELEQKQKDAEVLSHRCQQLESRNKLIETELISNRDLFANRMNAIRSQIASIVENVPSKPKVLQNNKQLKADLSVAQKALSDIVTLVNER